MKRMGMIVLAVAAAVLFGLGIQTMFGGSHDETDHTHGPKPTVVIEQPTSLGSPNPGLWAGRVTS